MNLRRIPVAWTEAFVFVEGLPPERRPSQVEVLSRTVSTRRGISSYVNDEMQLSGRMRAGYVLALWLGGGR